MSDKTAAIVGSGVIGSGWAARFALMGWDVKIFDPSEAAQNTMRSTMIAAKSALPSLYNINLPAQGKINFFSSLQEAVADCSWIQESASENIKTKLSILKAIQEASRNDAVIASSTSGFTPTALREGSSNPEQIIVAHPFNPVYLLPLVELVGKGAYIKKSAAILREIGMYPLIINKEIDAHIADRLMEAAWREALWLVHDDIATCKEIDDAIIYGFGLRWAQLGLFKTWELAGGEEGIAHFLRQFGPALKWPWTKLMDTPELSEELINKIENQCNCDSSLSIKELAAKRDDNLVSIIRSLKNQNWGAGKAIIEHEASLKNNLANYRDGKLISADRVIPNDWQDYNGHVNEAKYAEALSDASDVFLNQIGLTKEYLEEGFSWFSVENTINYFKETKVGVKIIITTKVLLLDGKKLKLLHEMYNDADDLLCSSKTLMLHVNLNTRKACEPPSQMLEKIKKFITNN